MEAVKDEEYMRDEKSTWKLDTRSALAEPKILQRQWLSTLPAFSTFRVIGPHSRLESIC